MANHDDYNRVSPFPSAKKLATVTIGDGQDLNTGRVQMVFGWVLVIAGIAMIYWLGLWALIPFVIGVLLLIAPYLM